jgi:hypothetical protein
MTFDLLNFGGIFDDRNAGAAAAERISYYINDLSVNNVLLKYFTEFRLTSCLNDIRQSG